MNQETFFMEVLAALETCEIPYMIAGSVGAMAYGEPRLTNDIDIVVDLRENGVERLLTLFAGDAYYVPSMEFVQAVIRRRGMFNIIHVTTGSKADIIIVKDDDFARSEFARRRHIPFLAGTATYAATPEDVIIAKLRYYHEGRSAKHPRDIAGILRISGERLDRPSIDGWVRRLGLEHAWETALGVAESGE